jgi:hypothetical protein
LKSRLVSRRPFFAWGEQGQPQKVCRPAHAATAEERTQVMMGHRKVFFRIERDVDGFPPVAAEGVWARPTEAGLYVVDNIPFFARAATLGDTVAVETEGGRLWYRTTVQASANSLLQVLTLTSEAVDDVVTLLRRLGCSLERDATGQLLAVNVPPEAPLPMVLAHLAVLASGGLLAYEAVLLRQP